MTAKENHDLQEFTAFCEKEGIHIKDENGHYKNTYDVLSEIANHHLDIASDIIKTLVGCGE